MANHELDQLYVVNPTDKPFGVKWGGVLYTLQPGEKKIWMRFLAQHFAKHLTDAILMGKEQEHKKAYLARGGSERDYTPKSFLNSRTLRPQTIDSILTGVYQYHQTAVVDPNTMIQQQIDQMNPNQPKEREMDLGTAADPLYGVMKDDKPDESPTIPQPIPSQPGASMIPVSGPGSVPLAPPPLPPQPPSTPEPTPTAPDDDGRGMKELRAEAAKLDITVPFGTTKDQLKEMIKKQYA